MEGIWSDLKHAVRALRSAPSFTAVAVGALALGIGANTAIFSLAHTLLLRPMPFPEAARIVTPISVNTRGVRDGGIPYADYNDWRQSGVFERLALWRPASLDLTGGEVPERVRAIAVTGEYFAVFGVSPLAGTVFDAAAERPGDRPIVLSEGAWRRLFGGRTDAIGRTLHLSGLPHTLIGVLPEARIWPADTDAVVPLRLDPASDPSLLRRDNFVFRAIARLRPDVTVDLADARLKTMAAGVEQEFAKIRTGWSYEIVGLQEYTVGEDSHRAILILSAAVGLVLLIACGNVANLVLARGTDRRRELALRAVLGASRAQLRQVLLAESLLLAAGGGIAGLTLGYWLSRALVLIAPADLPELPPMALDWPMLIFTVGVSAATAVIFGSLPALTTSRVTPNDALKEGGRSGSSGWAERMRDTLVVAEMALAVVLLVVSALAIQSLLAVTRMDPGVEVDGVLGARIIVPAARYPTDERRIQFYEGLLERVAALPGVKAAAITSRLPAGGPGFGLGRVFLAEGQPEPPAGSDHPAQWTVVSPSYFSTLGVRVLRGRPLAPQDTASATPVVVISERLAEAMFPGQDPIGRRIRSWRDENKLREIVGVVADVKYFGLADRPRSAVYVPHAQNAWGTLMLAIKTDGDPLRLVSAVRGAVTASDPLLALGDVGALADFSADSVSGSRFTSRLLGTFAVLALVLAGVGVYGIMAYVVSRRSHEIGVRLALGAGPVEMARLVIGRGMTMAAIGLVVGGGAAAAAVRALRSAVPELGAADPLSFAVAAGLLFTTALLACAVPARRATRMDPLQALRAE